MAVKASSTPLQVKIVLMNQFPQVPPIVEILAQVVHEDICKISNKYQGKHLRDWNPATSNICTLLYNMKMDFDVNAPIPKALLAARSVPEPPKKEEAVAFDPIGEQPVQSKKVDSAQVARERAQKEIMEKQEGLLKALSEAVDQASPEELLCLSENESDRRLLVLKNQEFMKIHEQVQEAEDITYNLAKLNLDSVAAQSEA